MEEILKKNKICAILRKVPLEITRDYVEAVYKGGIRVFEVAMNSPEAAKQIQIMRRALEGMPAYVGAGTVTTEENCRIASDAGAQFFLTPSASVCTMKYCRKQGMPLLPGVLTPTDVAVCLQYGYHIFKLFPAGDMKMNYIKSLKGPFDGTEYVAVGGVYRQNIRMFLDNGFIGVGIGSHLVPQEFVAERNWEKISESVRELVILAGEREV